MMNRDMPVREKYFLLVGFIMNIRYGVRTYDLVLNRK